MAFSLDSLFTTRTALPKNCGVTEIEPIAALKPYVRCFWTYEHSCRNIGMRIIPDCCADVIIDLDKQGASFVGMCLDSFIAENVLNVFGIRFYAWAVPRLVRTDAPLLYGNNISPDSIFYRFSAFKESIICAETTAERVEIAQKYLVGLIDEHCDRDVMNSIYAIITNNGNITVSDLSDGIAVSKRTLERKFMLNTGFSPKSIIEAIRYQLLWQDCIKRDFCVLDGVEKFGYYDQAHMYNDFKKYHGIGLAEARNEFINLSHFYNTVLQ